jgi:hypothetical protein
MKKVPIELFYRRSEQVTIILPDNLNPLQVSGIVQQLLRKLGLPTAKVVIQGKEESIDLSDVEKL